MKTESVNWKQNLAVGVAATFIGGLLLAIALRDSSGDRVETVPTQLPPTTTTSLSETTMTVNPTMTMSSTTSSTAPPATQPRLRTAYLADGSLFTPDDALSYSSGVGRINGEVFPRSIRLYTYSQAAGSVRVSYVLARKYQRLMATMGIDDGATSNHRIRMEVFADSATIFRRDFVKGESIALDEDVTGVYSIRFVVTKLDPDSVGSHGDGVFGDARVTG